MQIKTETDEGKKKEKQEKKEKKFSNQQLNQKSNRYFRMEEKKNNWRMNKEKPFAQS